MGEIVEINGPIVTIRLPSVLTGEQVRVADIQAIIDLGRGMTGHPIRLLEGVEDALDGLEGRRLLLVLLLQLQLQLVVFVELRIGRRRRRQPVPFYLCKMRRRKWRRSGH